MADFVTSLPVKTQAAGDVSVKIDQTTPGTTNNVALSAGSTALQAAGGTAANSLRVNLATDVGLPTGTNSIGKISDVTTSVTPGTGAAHLGKSLGAAGVALASGDVGVVALGVRNDSASTTLNGTNGNYGAIALDSVGRVWIRGSHVDGGAFTAGSNGVMTIGAVFDDSGPTSASEDTTRSVRMSANRSVYAQIRDAAGNERGLNIDANGRATVNSITSDGVVTGKIHDYMTAVVTAGTTSTSAFQHSVGAGKTFLCKQIIVSGSGELKAEVQNGPTGTLASRAVMFNSTASPNIVFTFPQPLECPDTSTGLCRVLVTNRESQDLSAYVTFIGVEV